MSFSDLERGQPLQDRQGSSRDADFEKLANRMSLQIFKINGNTTGIGKLVDLLGTPRDTPAIRKKLHDLSEVTRDIVKGAPDDLKALASYEVDSRQRKLEQAKIARDFQAAVTSFQRMQQRSAKQQKAFVEKAKAAANEEEQMPRAQTSAPLANQEQAMEMEDQTSRTEAMHEQPQFQLQDQTYADVVPDSEVEYQEQLIEEREGEIRQIESGIHELNDIFRDLGTIVHEQQSMLDNIETNVNNIASDTDRAADELTTAHRYQKARGRRMCYLLIIFAVVLAIVILAVLA